ncbi:metallophosphoesterase family protein [Baaleninema sp.]|uniref:metallophosphoesterase family protein n=1 Tax=Baaleninema sp. TaxID=3101197 RepID=UPI003D067221
MIWTTANHWAILSGVEGNLAAYEAVLKDIRRQRIPVDTLYILGDVVGLHPDCEALVERLRSPKAGEPVPQICTGWWEEQYFNLHGVGGDPEAQALRETYGDDVLEKLWNNLSRESVEWLRSLDFGFLELDCLLIHGSTVSPSDELTPNTPPTILLDRLLRAQANQLFCGRSGLAFECHLESGAIGSQVTTLDGDIPPVSQTLTPRKVIGVGSLSRDLDRATYTLYLPHTNRLQFRTVAPTRTPVARGFG